MQGPRGITPTSDYLVLNVNASALAVEVNFEILDEEPEKVVVYLDSEEFHTTWLGNKAVYRTRMAIADGGELVVLAPGVALLPDGAGYRLYLESLFDELSTEVV